MSSFIVTRFSNNSIKITDIRCFNDEEKAWSYWTEQGGVRSCMRLYQTFPNKAPKLLSSDANREKRLKKLQEERDASRCMREGQPQA